MTANPDPTAELSESRRTAASDIPPLAEDVGPEVAATLDLDWETTEPAASGEAVIATAVKTLPNAPGVYRMIDADGDVLYVGKARSLKKRVISYTRVAGQSGRIARMIRATATMDFVRTRTETEALLLEANLIKRLRPRFNVLFRDDKSFPYILIAEDHEAPAIMKHRGARRRKGSYFGPFASAGAVGRTVNTLQKAFLIRTCSDAVFASRTRPCLLFQIKRCSAPCTREIALDDYRRLVAEAKAFLTGSSQEVKAELARAMEAASATSISKAPRSTATGSPRCRTSSRTRASTHRASTRPTSSRCIRTAGSPRSRSSSSAPDRTGETAPIFRRPTRASTRRPCSSRSSRSSTTTSRCRG